ncbi:MAG: copper-binding protein [Candidatus Marinimicrobia bacterium]|nr:copper-binding protein [Candidatus Neomarinimicrobiota bacterium]
MKKIILISLVLFLINCSGNNSYSVRGTILEVRKDSNEFLIHHDEIPGFMMAMTMPFKLADTLDINKFNVGDSLQFRLIMGDKRAIASEFQLLGKGTLPETEDIWEDEYTSLDIGKIFTDVTLLDLDSNAVKLSDSDGKFRLISYIFTRCPMPNMCPAVVVKNQYLAKVFNEIPEIEFFLVSFDYIFDTPSILKINYGSLVDTNPNLKIYSSFGHINDIFTLGGQSLVSFWGIEENDIGHSLRSVLIDPERRLLKAFDGLDWRPESAEREIRNILKAYSL